MLISSIFYVYIVMLLLFRVLLRGNSNLLIIFNIINSIDLVSFMDFNNMRGGRVPQVPSEPPATSIVPIDLTTDPNFKE